jgi:hypothetical protein
MRSLFVRSPVDSRLASALSIASAICAMAPAYAEAHCLAGGRIFPSTLAIEEPCVHEGMALPDFAAYGTGDRPANRETAIGGHYSKRVFENVAVMAGRPWSRLSTPGRVISGLGAIETGVKYQFVTLPEQELIVSTSFFVEWGKTGRQSLGAPAYNVYMPTISFGKGFGDLPNALNALRPFAVTGDFGYAIPGWRRTGTIALEQDGLLGLDVERHPQVFKWGFSLQYSMSYLRQHIYDFDLPDVVNKLVPLVEVALETPVANTLASGRTTVGSVNPGLIYVTKAWQFGAEAIIPINRSSGKGVGARAQLHLILDEILPPAISRPLFAGGPPMITSLGSEK